MGTKTALTWEQFLAAGKEWERWEYVDGEVIFMSPHMGGKHFWTVKKICHAANQYEIKHQDWLSVHTDVAFTLASGNWRCPDWGLVRRARFDRGVVPEGPIPFPPDVAFEVISQHDTLANIPSKKRDYQLNDVVQVWVDPDERSVEVISLTHGTKTFAAGQKVKIEELPGFELNLFPLTSEM